jgi:hypothetical protein
MTWFMKPAPRKSRKDADLQSSRPSLEKWSSPTIYRTRGYHIFTTSSRGACRRFGG